jgi:hypothetical protein
MEHSPSWKACRLSSGQKHSSLLWNPKVHYCVHKRSPLGPIARSSIRSIHWWDFRFSRRNIPEDSRLQSIPYLRSLSIKYYHLKSSYVSFSSEFPTKSVCVRLSHSPYACYMEHHPNLQHIKTFSTFADPDCLKYSYTCILNIDASDYRCVLQCSVAGSVTARSAHGSHFPPLQSTHLARTDIQQIKHNERQNLS